MFHTESTVQIASKKVFKWDKLTKVIVLRLLLACRSPFVPIHQIVPLMKCTNLDTEHLAQSLRFSRSCWEKRVCVPMYAECRLSRLFPLLLSLPAEACWSWPWLTGLDETQKAQESGICRPICTNKAGGLMWDHNSTQSGSVRGEKTAPLYLCRWEDCVFFGRGW